MRYNNYYNFSKKVGQYDFFYKKISSFNYSIPISNIETIIYDFYFLESLRKVDLSPGREDISLQDFYETTFSTVIKYLKNLFINELQPIVIYYLNSDIKELLTNTDHPFFKETYVNFLNKFLEDGYGETEEEARIYLNNILENIENYFDQDPKQFLLEVKPLIEGGYTYTKYSNISFKEIRLGHAPPETVGVFQGLVNSSDISSDIYWIDRMIDLEHGGGSLFEYFTELQDQNIDNIEKAIENKSQFRTYEDFLPYISPSLKPFAYKVIYNLTGKTQEMRQANIRQVDEPQNNPISSNQSPKIQTNLNQGLETMKNTQEYQKTKDDRDYRLDTAQIYENLLKRKIAYLTSQVYKYSFVSHCPGHKNSAGESAEWCVKSHDDGHIISSHKTEEEAKKHLRDMHTHK